VGCYIDTIVLRGRAAPGDTAAELVARTGRVCRKALAHRDYPFDALIDDLRAAPAESRDQGGAPGRPPLFDVLVDFVPGTGAIAGAAETADLAIAERALTAEAAHYDTMFLIEETGDDAALAVRLVMPAARYTQETADRAADRLLAILRWLTAGDGAPLGGVELMRKRAATARRLQVSLNTD
jgi:non-ribosomal peptide synthetase component F